MSTPNNKVRSFYRLTPSAQTPDRPAGPVPPGGSAALPVRIPASSAVMVARSFKMDVERDRELERIAVRLGTSPSEILRTITIRAIDSLGNKPRFPASMDRTAALANFVGSILVDCASDGRIDKIERTRIVQECARLLNEIVNGKEKAA